MMENTSLLKKLPDPLLIREISLETGIEQAFLEKDWYAVQLVSIVAKHVRAPNISPLFSGGTSLSKAHGLIKRFSEDLDFLLSTSDNITKGQRRSFRQNIINYIDKQEPFRIVNTKLKLTPFF